MSKPALILRLAAVCSLTVAVAACASPEERKAKYLARGDAHLAAGRPADAVIEYRNALKIDPRFGVARFNLARALEANRNQGAAQEFIVAAELLPDRADVQLKAAGLLLSAKQFERARQHADRALAADPASIEAQVIRAYSLAGLQHPDAAIEELEKAAAQAPGDYRPYASLGDLKAASGNFADAEAAFKKAVQADPASTEPKLALAYFYGATKRPADSERVLLEVLKADEANLSANRLLAILYLGTKRPKEAEASLLRLADQNDLRARLALADLYASTGRRDEARPLYESMRANDATREVAVARLAGIDYTSGRKKAALDLLESELAQSPKSLLLLIVKAQLLTSEGRTGEAVAAATAATEIDPNSQQAHYALGIARAASREYQAAVSAFNEALRLYPSMTEAHIQLSQVLLVLGETDRALQHAQTAKRAAPDNPQVRVNAARALLRKGDVRTAETEVRSLVQQFPESAAVRALYGSVLLARSDGAGAIRELDRALALDPAEAEALAGRVIVDLSLKRPQEARNRVERAVAAAPNSADVMLVAARFEITERKPAAAETYLRRAIELDPTNLEAYNFLATIYVDQRRLDEAKRELQEVARRRPPAVAARTMIGVIQTAQGQTAEAIKTYDALLRDAAVAPVAANNLAYLHLERGEQLDLALELAQTAKQHLPDSPDISDTLGWAYYKKGMPALAVAPLEFSVQKDPKNALYLVHLGLAYAKAGDAAKAKSTLTQALKLNADVEGAEEARAVLASQ